MSTRLALLALLGLQRNGWFRNEGETENHLIHILHHGVIRKLAPL